VRSAACRADKVIAPAVNQICRLCAVAAGGQKPD